MKNGYGLCHTATGMFYHDYDGGSYLFEFSAVPVSRKQIEEILSTFDKYIEIDNYIAAKTKERVLKSEFQIVEI